MDMERSRLNDVLSFEIVFFFETEAKILPRRLIKKKRIARLINGKPGKNRYI